MEEDHPTGEDRLMEVDHPEEVTRRGGLQADIPPAGAVLILRPEDLLIIPLRVEEEDRRHHLRRLVDPSLRFPRGYRVLA